VLDICCLVFTLANSYGPTQLMWKGILNIEASIDECVQVRNGKYKIWALHWISESGCIEPVITIKHLGRVIGSLPPVMSRDVPCHTLGCSTNLNCRKLRRILVTHWILNNSCFITVMYDLYAGPVMTLSSTVPKSCIAMLRAGKSSLMIWSNQSH